MWFVRTNYDLCNVRATAVLYEITCYIGPLYNSTRLYAFCVASRCWNSADSWYFLLEDKCLTISHGVLKSQRVSICMNASALLNTYLCNVDIFVGILEVIFCTNEWVKSQILEQWLTQIAEFMGPTWGPPGSCRPQMGPMLAPWTLLSGEFMAESILCGPVGWLLNHSGT